MNPNTLVSVHCYQGDEDRVRHAASLGLYQHHECPCVVMSPLDSKVKIEGVECQYGGGVGYIGAVSLSRQVKHMEILLMHPHEWFLMNDSDSFCLARELPAELYSCPDTIWSNEVVEPRPHESPYPKLAFQPPYFIHRHAIWRMLQVAGKVGCHEITPYIDWQMNALSAEAGLKHRAFTELERPTTEICSETDPWKILEFRIKKMGAIMMHPIKTPEQFQICKDAYVNRQS